MVPKPHLVIPGRERKLANPESRRRCRAFNDERKMTPEDVLARLLYRDGLMLVVDKPAGMPVHRGPKGVEAFEDYFGALRFGLPRPPALAHRLDRDTTGCLVLGRHRKALALLGKLFKQGKVGKTYWAVVEGAPDADEGRIEIALSKRDESRGWWMKADQHGSPSVTTWKVLGRYPSPDPFSSTSLLVGEVVAEGGGKGLAVGSSTTTAAPNPSPQGGGECAAASGKAFTWLALNPLTGRTHQLRVHCAEMGFPIVGDTIYGTASRTGGPPLHLHSREVVVPISKNKPPVVVTALVPRHMQELLTACGWAEEPHPLVPAEAGTQR
jgi:tRNA pseudouridine32 synthase / 23S rRNA pseudouridine746 synthase